LACEAIREAQARSGGNQSSLAELSDFRSPNPNIYIPYRSPDVQQGVQWDVT